MRRNKIPTIFGLFILLIGLAAGLILVKFPQIFKPGASPNSNPQNVKITNITSSGFTVNWATNQENLGFIKWGTDANLGNTGQSATVTPTFTHSVTVTSLKAGSTYFFKINSDAIDYDNSGSPWQVKLATASQNKQPNLISGKVIDTSGSPASDAIVYIAVSGGSLISTTTSSTGTWVTSVSNIPTNALDSFVQVDSTTEVTISVDAGPRGQSTVQALISSSNPTPDIVLGRNSDFTNSQNSSSGENPNASIELPSQASASSKFNVSGGSGIQPVTIDSVNPGETISTTRPQFFGQGPVGLTLSLLLESQVLTAKVKIDSKGEWKWNVPTDIASGSHRLTVSWTDSKGVLQSIIRDFIVEASSNPAFQASASASLAPSLTPTPTSSASVSLQGASPTETPQPTETASNEASVIETPSPSPLPQTGALTPTIALFMMGIATIIFGVLLWKRSEI